MDPRCPLCSSDAVIVHVARHTGAVTCVACGSVCPREFLGTA